MNADPATPAPAETRAETDATTSAPARRSLKVVEDYQLIDVANRHLSTRTDEVLASLSPDSFAPGVTTGGLQSRTGWQPSVQELASELTALRAQANAAADALGLAIAAVGSVPVAPKASVDASYDPRYRVMSAHFGLLAREQPTGGTRIHVSLANRDQALAIAPAIAEYVPLFLALSASSPYDGAGQDTGYASSRYLEWARWPVTGSHPPVHTAADYEQLVETLTQSHVISNEQMMFYDVRPSIYGDGIELRIADACPSVETLLLIVGLFRALVDREVARLDGEFPTVNAALQRAATWRAARSGMEDDLLSPITGEPTLAREVLMQVVDELREQLTANGDAEAVEDAAAMAVIAGSSAFRQRRALRRRGMLDDVVDLVLAETSGTADGTGLTHPSDELFRAYEPIEGVELTRLHDEAVDSQAHPREGYESVVDSARRLGSVGLRAQQIQAEHDLTVRGVTFRVSNEPHSRAFPMDMMPRVIDEPTWRHLTAGVEQRAKAINCFLNDVYGEQAIIRDGKIGLDILDKSPGFKRIGYTSLPGAVRNHISGADLIYSAKDGWQILEDNVRMPSGTAFAVEARAMSQRNYPELFATAPAGLNDPSGCYAMFRETMLATAPKAAGDDPYIVLSSAGRHDPSYFEQEQIAAAAGFPIRTADQLLAEDGALYDVSSGTRRRIDAIYQRQEEEMFLSSRDAAGTVLRYPVQSAISSGRLTIANAMGNGIGDDKAVYAFVPEMIDYYLGEKPILSYVPTYLCAIREQRDAVLERLDELVVKPIDGYGGSGITVGPEATEEELKQRREELMVRPEQFIAQEVVSLSTLPTFEGVSMQPRHVDLRLFVHLRATGSTADAVEAVTAPVGLTRVAPAGSLIVNSSRGGGGKDTWIVTGEGR